MVNLFPYFWKRIIITGVWPDENEKLNIKIHWFMAETIDIRELNERIERQSAFIEFRACLILFSILFKSSSLKIFFCFY